MATADLTVLALGRAGASADEYIAETEEGAARGALSSLSMVRPTDRPPWRRTFAAAVLALSLLVSAPSTAGAGVAFRSTVDPPELLYPGGRELTYRLEMRTGDRQEELGLSLTPGGWGGGRFGEAGSPLAPIGVALEGPGRMELGPELHGDPARCLRGSVIHFTTVDVTLPADSISTLVARYRTGFAPPLPGARYGLVAEASGGTLDRPVSIELPGPRLRGRRGVRIGLQTAPRSSDEIFVEPPSIRRGQPISLSGTTDPPVAGQRIELRYRYEGSEATGGRPAGGVLATIRADRRGRFRHRGWRPRRRGLYRLTAAYRSQRRSLASDESCSRYFRLR